jgi:hypothetical protein
MPHVVPLAAVMAGLDPAIQPGPFNDRGAARSAKRILRGRRLDGRVKPGHDVKEAGDSRTKEAAEP